MPKLLLMCGLPASGKSSHAQKLQILENAILFESDWYRHLHFDDKQDKQTNILLFDMINKQTCVDLSIHKNNVILDSTGLSYKNRMELIKKVKSLPNSKDIRIVSHVMMTDIEICVKRDSERERTVGEKVINRMRENFWMPMYQEGFDEIHISYSFNPEKYQLGNLIEKMKSFNQENPHHTKTLLGHTYAVYDALTSEDKLLQLAAMYHDIGKLYTGKFEDARGNPSNICHYYNHAQCSSYEAFFYLKNMGIYTDNEIIKICNLINFHMRIYDLNSEKSINKFKELIGKKMYMDLIKLNIADRNGK